MKCRCASDGARRQDHGCKGARGAFALLRWVWVIACAKEWFVREGGHCLGSARLTATPCGRRTKRTHLRLVESARHTQQEGRVCILGAKVVDQLRQGAKLRRGILLHVDALRPGEKRGVQDIAAGRAVAEAEGADVRRVVHAEGALWVAFERARRLRGHRPREEPRGNLGATVNVASDAPSAPTGGQRWGTAAPTRGQWRGAARRGSRGSAGDGRRPEAPSRGSRGRRLPEAWRTARRRSRCPAGDGRRRRGCASGQRGSCAAKRGPLRGREHVVGALVLGHADGLHGYKEVFRCLVEAFVVLLHDGRRGDRRRQAWAGRRRGGHGRDREVPHAVRVLLDAGPASEALQRRRRQHSAGSG